MILDRLGRSIWRGDVVVAWLNAGAVLLYVARCHQRNWGDVEVQFMTLELPDGFSDADGISSVVGGYGRVIDFRVGTRLGCEVVYVS